MIVTLVGCVLLDSSYKLDLGTVPEDLDDGWVVGAPEDVGLDPDVLADLHRELLREDQFFATLGMLIVKDGVLVFETYLRDPADRDEVNALQSATKSVTSLVVGLGQGEGWWPADLTTPLCDLLGDACDGLGPQKHAITLDHVLTMRSGLDLDNHFMAYDLLVRQPEDPLRYLLELPMYADPGDRFYYRDVDPQLTSYAIQAAAGETEEEVAARALFEPLGIVDWYWEPLNDGATTGAFGLQLRPRDFAKLGWLAASGGTWDGEAVVPASWIAGAIEALEPDAWEGWGYGRYFWSSPDRDAVTMAGHGGQFAMWVPDEGLLAVQIAMPYGALHGDAPADLYEIIRPLW